MPMRVEKEIVANNTLIAFLDELPILSLFSNKQKKQVQPTLDSYEEISEQELLKWRALVASSGWSYLQCGDLKFARIAFILYIVNGVVGVMTYGLWSQSLRLYKTYSTVNQCSLLVILPLLATQLYINQGFDYNLALFNLCFPIVHALVLQLARLQNSRLPFLEMLQCVPLLSIGYLSVINIRYYGLALVLSYTISFYAIGTTGMVYSTPSKDLFNISIIFANYFTMNALKGL